MKATAQHHVRLGDRRVNYRVVRSRTARKLRLRIGPNGVEVVQPSARSGKDVRAFLDRSETWVLNQLKRVERLRSVRQPGRRRVGEILFRGELTPVRVETAETRAQGNLVAFVDAAIVIRRGAQSRTPAARSLENWLRRQASMDIARHLSVITARLRQKPHRVYVMGQRTKWGNCSGKRNLSFNWRLILAPDFVLRYLVTHEAVHLAIPDHSAKFWLTVRSLCRETETAKQWLRGHRSKLMVDLRSALAGAPEPRRVAVDPSDGMAGVYD